MLVIFAHLTCFTLAACTNSTHSTPSCRAVGTACGNDGDCCTAQANAFCVDWVCRTDCTGQASCGYGETCTSVSGGVEACLPSGGGGGGGGGTSGDCGTTAAYNVPSCDTYLNASCCSSMNACWNDSVCQACLLGTSSSGCSSNTNLQAFSDCACGGQGATACASVCTGGPGTDGGTSSGPTNLAAQTVGAYSEVGSTCSSGSSWTGYGFFLCPGGRIRGAGSMGGATELVCGSYTTTPATQDNCQSASCYAKVNVTAKDTLIMGGQSDVQDGFQFQMYFLQTTSGVNRLARPAQCSDNSTGYILIDEIDANVSSDYCVSSTCNPTGSSSASCGTDCDCGHCWYCESGTCRYGGEGPSGCYRGCS